VDTCGFHAKEVDYMGDKLKTPKKVDKQKFEQSERKFMNTQLVVDVSILESQAREVAGLLKANIPQCSHDILIRYRDDLLSNLVLGERVTTVTADGGREVALRPHFGNFVDRLRTALGTSKVDRLSHGNSIFRKMGIRLTRHATTGCGFACGLTLVL
jgi:hypothetical protein